MQFLFPDAELAEDAAQEVVGDVLAGDGAQSGHGSAQPILEPRVAAERTGVVPRVVFPTGVDVQGHDTLDVYYGMADSRIGVARASLAGLATPPGTVRLIASR